MVTANARAQWMRQKLLVKGVEPRACAAPSSQLIESDGSATIRSPPERGSRFEEQCTREPGGAPLRRQGAESSGPRAARRPSTHPRLGAPGLCVGNSKQRWELASDAPPRLLGRGGSLAGPVSAETNTVVFRVGVLALDGPENTANWNEFVAELSRRGYVEGRNLLFVRRVGGEELGPARIEKLAIELVALKPQVIFAGYGSLSARSMKRATTTIPVVFFSSAGFDVFPKTLQYLRELIGKLHRIVGLYPRHFPSLPWFLPMEAAIKAAATRLGANYETVYVSSFGDIEREISRAKLEGVDAIMFDGQGSSLLKEEARIAALCVKLRLAAVGNPEAGFLLTQDVDGFPLARKSAEYVDRILRGARPADLPIEHVPTYLAINRKTAEAIGLKLTESLLLRAGRVIG